MSMIVCVCGSGKVVLNDLSGGWSGMCVYGVRLTCLWWMRLSVVIP
jgi:hypothetical protein